MQSQFASNWVLLCIISCCIGRQAQEDSKLTSPDGKGIGFWWVDGQDRRNRGFFPPHPFFFDGSTVTVRYVDKGKGRHVMCKLHAKWHGDDLWILAPWDDKRWIPEGKWQVLGTLRDKRFQCKSLHPNLADRKTWYLKQMEKAEAPDEFREFFRDGPIYEYKKQDGDE